MRSRVLLAKGAIVAFNLVLAVGLAPASLAQAPASPEAAREPQTLNVDDKLEAIRAKHGVPALAAVLIADDRVVMQGVAGVRAEGSPQRAAIDDLWHIGSDTKAMTAVLCARLVEKGTLRWDMTLVDAFPDLAAGMDERWRGVTLEQLLSHRAGVPKDLNQDGLWRRLWQLSNAGSSTVDARREMLVTLTKRPPASDPGSTYLYSNGGYMIAGHIAETLAGKPWEDLMREEVFGPLGISRAGFGAPGSKGTIDQPRGHRGQAPALVAVEPGPDADNPSSLGPAGTVHVALADWAKFAAAVARGERGGGAAAGFLKPETWAKLHTPVGGKGPNDGYALGWGVTTRPWAKGSGEGDVGRVLTHAGSNTMWFAVAWIAPERNFAVLVASNVSSQIGPKAADEAASTLITLWRQSQDPAKE